MDEHALAEMVLAFGDDEFILGHRDSEWTGHAPILEEDIAFANIALDELGHAQLWYGLYQAMTGIEPDRLVYFREADAYRCAQFVELLKGDWAFSMLRQYLFDAAEAVLLPALAASTDTRISEIAAKIRPEEIYHLRHTSNWVKRLGLGTEESHRRMQSALDEMWSYALQLFVPLPHQVEWVEKGVMPDPTKLQREWEQQVVAFLNASGLVVPTTRIPAAISRAAHTNYLPELLTDMQQVARSEAYGVEW
ncbi:MAG TPA: 1,2-phenylacetyl-CoA epoxidase subunit PaaC [Anaerolineae bacterium]|nr:1,2-phenylacetyl-CoA epoxidase subunit PaaC [Anaerolineae bacterium]